MLSTTEGLLEELSPIGLVFYWQCGTSVRGSELKTFAVERGYPFYLEEEYVLVGFNKGTEGVVST